MEDEEEEEEEDVGVEDKPPMTTTGRGDVVLAADSEEKGKTENDGIMQIEFTFCIHFSFIIV